MRWSPFLIKQKCHGGVNKFELLVNWKVVTIATHQKTDFITNTFQKLLEKPHVIDNWSRKWFWKSVSLKQTSNGRRWKYFKGVIFEKRIYFLQEVVASHKYCYKYLTFYYFYKHFYFKNTNYMINKQWLYQKSYIKRILIGF